MTRIVSLVGIAVLATSVASAQDGSLMGRGGGGQSQSGERQSSESRQTSSSRNVQYKSSSRGRQDESRSKSSRNNDRDPIVYRSESARPYEIHNAPRGSYNGRPTISEQVRRSSTVVINGNKGDWRVGVVYRDDRRPDYRCRDYVYYPSSRVFVSPFYLYPELPPYLSSSCPVTTVSPYFDRGGSWTHYNYCRPSDRWDNDNRDGWNNWDQQRDLDRSLDQLTESFERQDSGSSYRLLPRYGDVAIYQDGNYSYHLQARDFSDMFYDLVERTQTRDYQIVEVRKYSNDRVRVLAVQRRRDSWDRNSEVYHDLRLSYEGRSWVIRGFGTSRNRPY